MNAVSANSILSIMIPSKLQTAKINQGNIALKRVVESIANGDSHVPFRDSKLTMLLQVKLQSCYGAIYDSPFPLALLFFLSSVVFILSIGFI